VTRCIQRHFVFKLLDLGLILLVGTSVFAGITHGNKKDTWHSDHVVLSLHICSCLQDEVKETLGA
jgi:hypothetical protein